MENDNFSKISEVIQLFNIEKMFFLFIGLAILISLVKYFQRSSERLYGRFPSKRLIILQLSTVGSFIIYIFGFSTIFYVSLRPSKEVLLAAAGSAAVAFGFALKDIVSSLVAGLILLFDRPFQVGDRVTYNGVYGEIKSIGLRTVRLLTLDESVVTIPNSKFVTDYVMSANTGDLHMMLDIPFHVAIDESIDKVKEILYEVAVTSRFVYLNSPVLISVKEVEVAQRLALRFSLKACVLDVHYEKAFETDIVTRVQETFIKENIRRPTFES
jgi:small-conductance mechanosensitive channel